MLAVRMRSCQGSDPGTREERQQKSQSKLGRIDLCSVVWSRMDKVLVVNTPARFGDRGRATTWYRGAVCDEDTRSWILMLGLEFLQIDRKLSWCPDARRQWSSTRSVLTTGRCERKRDTTSGVTPFPAAKQSIGQVTREQFEHHQAHGLTIILQVAEDGAVCVCGVLLVRRGGGGGGVVWCVVFGAFCGVVCCVWCVYVYVWCVGVCVCVVVVCGGGRRSDEALTTTCLSRPPRTGAPNYGGRTPGTENPGVPATPEPSTAHSCEPSGLDKTILRQRADGEQQTAG